VFIRILSRLILFFAGPAVSFATQPLAKGIQDNSFLVEEAYNQEAGVVQHILNVLMTSKAGQKETSTSFTQEWPIFSQHHQFSYTVPHTFVEGEHGFEDIRLNYRFQALMEAEQNPAFAPRFTLVVPIGDADKGFGHDRLGYEINLPFSKIVGDRIQNPFWLTLLGLILGERLMGVPGMILAPVILHYVKLETSQIEVKAIEKPE